MNFIWFAFVMCTEFRNAMYTKINNVEFIDMPDRDKFIYLMKYHWKDVSQYIELAWDKRTNIIYKGAWLYFLLLVWLNLHNIM